MASRSRDPVLLYDGSCVFCNGVVRFIVARDRAGAMRFAPLQGETARAILVHHPALAGSDSLVLVELGQGSQALDQVSGRSDAVLRVAEYLGGPWRAARVLHLVPRFLRDGVYDLFAAWRHRLFGRCGTCPVPEPAVRERFLP
jgi:predicted DCC family thiol-disulfide oxidoreductase YuxK